MVPREVPSEPISSIAPVERFSVATPICVPALSKTGTGVCPLEAVVLEAVVLEAVVLEAVTLDAVAEVPVVAVVVRIAWPDWLSVRLPMTAPFGPIKFTAPFCCWKTPRVAPFEPTSCTGPVAELLTAVPIWVPLLLKTGNAAALLVVLPVAPAPVAADPVVVAPALVVPEAEPVAARPEAVLVVVVPGAAGVLVALLSQPVFGS
jgi:hypothetical protein